MRYYLTVLFIILLLVVPWFASNYPGEVRLLLGRIEIIGGQLANVFIAHNPKTIDQIKSRYASAGQGSFFSSPKKVRVLLVPGHEPESGGAEFGSLKERQMTVQIAQNLKEFLLSNPRYEVIVSRNSNTWNPIFENYFRSYWSSIREWVDAHKEEVTNMIQLGIYKPIESPIFHNKAPDDVALRLYGVGKWANENDVDMVIHLHFNDYPGHSKRAPGIYSGFTIYVPEQFYSNSSTTKILADSIFKRLQKFNPVSDLSGESAGVVPDPDLIAVGAFNSVNAPSMLIEYGYIYEPQFTDEGLNRNAIKDLAYETYLGIQDVFDPDSVKTASTSDSLILPHIWNFPLSKSDSVGIFALQTALTEDGVYPPANKSMNDCPRTGSIGPCTKSALKIFQEKYGIEGEEGVVGKKTVEILNNKFGR
jgi:N-acetylmuramoyl-L-alanine amidase